MSLNTFYGQHIISKDEQKYEYIKRNLGHKNRIRRLGTFPT